MPRTLNPATYAVRRDVFLDAAERLMVARGWEQVTLQDILDEAGASKGAFYHYFDSREAVAQAVVERMTDAAMVVIAPIANDPGLPAAAKLQAVFSTAGRWKSERSDLLMAFIRSWYSDENDVVRLRAARAGQARLGPVFAGIVRQGKEEGAFTPTSPEHAAAILLALFNGSSDAIGRLVLDRQEGRVSFADVERFIRAYEEAIERILGLPPGSFVLIETPALHIWFDRPATLTEERP
jgi:AcrR family transcriptional regulator